MISRFVQPNCVLFTLIKRISSVPFCCKIYYEIGIELIFHLCDICSVYCFLRAKKKEQTPDFQENRISFCALMGMKRKIKGH